MTLKCQRKCARPGHIHLARLSRGGASLSRFFVLAFTAHAATPADLKINNEMVELSGILGRLQRDQIGHRG
jgi:hypothetical protein